MYEGIGMSVSHQSELVLRGLVAQPTAFVAGSAAKGDLLAGAEIVLVALVQARNNARAVVSGSLFLFSNAAFRAPVVTNNMQSYVVDGCLGAGWLFGTWLMYVDNTNTTHTHHVATHVVQEHIEHTCTTSTTTIIH